MLFCVGSNNSSKRPFLLQRKWKYKTNNGNVYISINYSPSTIQNNCQTYQNRAFRPNMEEGRVGRRLFTKGKIVTIILNIQKKKWRKTVIIKVCSFVWILNGIINKFIEHCSVDMARTHIDYIDPKSNVFPFFYSAIKSLRYFAES